MLGTPPDFRSGPSPLDGDRPDLVRAQLEELRDLKADAMDELDDFDRSAARLGVGPVLDKAVALARRYEAASDRRFKWAYTQLKKGASPIARPSASA